MGHTVGIFLISFRQPPTEKWAIMVLTCTFLQQTITLTQQTDASDLPKMIIGENRTFLDDRNFDRKTIDLDLDVFGKNESRKYKHEQTISNRRTIQDYHTATGYQIQETELTEAETPLSVSNALRHEDLTRAEEARLDEPISFEVGK